MKKEKHKDINEEKDIVSEIDTDAIKNSEESKVTIEESDVTNSVDEFKNNDPEETEVTKLQKQVISLMEQLLFSEDKYLRANAEFENFRKRSVREKKDIRINTQSNTINTILPVLDHFELAMLAAEDANNVSAVVDGMKLIKTEFEKALKSMDVEVVNALGETFDPIIHEAIANEVSDEYKDGIVSKQWRAGYKLGEKLIRPATVVVSSGPKSEEAE